MIMKKALLLTIVVLMAVTAKAAPTITRQQAKAKAQAFLEQRQACGKTMRRSAAVELREAATGLSELYAFNVEGGGFVIVSGDDRTLPVLGYSLTGSIDADDMPDNMRSWLQGYADEIAHLSKTYTAPKQTATSSLSPVQPLLKTTWYQVEPYDLMTPLYEGNKYTWKGKRCATGCVATAMAQVMYYHQWPQDATTTIPSYTFNYQEGEPCTLPELPATTFKWDLMLPDYTSQQPGTEEQRMAVAELMRYCGQATKMDYSPDASGTQHEFIANALRRYFGYSQGIYCADRAHYTIEQWSQLIWNELNQKRPVVFAGQSSSGGHEFVIDGYDGNDMFHVNWGWAGKNDGYFAINVLNPDDNTSVGSAGNTNLGFATNQQILVGIEKSTGTETVVPEVVRKLIIYNEPVALDTALVYVAAYTDFELRKASYYMGLGIKNADGSCTLVAQNDTATSFVNAQLAEFVFPKRKLTLTDGSHTLYPIAKDAQEPTAAWEFFGAPGECFTVDVKDGQVTIHPNMVMKIINAYFEKSPATPLEENTLILVVENQGDKEVSTVTQLNVGKTMGTTFVPAVDKSEMMRPTQLEKGERVTLRYPMVVPFKGDMEIFLLGLSDKVTLDKTVVNIENDPHLFDLKVVDYKIEYRDRFDLDALIYIKNDDTRTWKKPYSISMQSTMVGETGRISGSNYDTIPPGQTMELNASELDGIFSTSENLNDIRILIGTSYNKFVQGTTLLDVTVKQGTTVTPSGVTGISTIHREPSGNNQIYDLQGRRVNGQPARGIYIMNNKKIFIK